MVPASLTTLLAGRYRFERVLGQGGMATVYLAEDLRHERTVAIKVLRPDLAAAVGQDRFAREILITGKLNHPNLLPVLDSGADAATGLCWYAMPFVDGETLRQRLTREVQLPVDDALRLFGEVADAVGHAHRLGFVHRDIKPENILLHEGHARVTDFGIARVADAASIDRLTESGIALGTPHYMSPEQSLGQGNIDARSDIYALGCLLYEMLAGGPPFHGPTAQAIMARHAVEPVPGLRTVRATVPPFVEAAVMKALAKVPADRFSSVEDFVAAVTTPAAEITRRPAPRSIAIAVMGLVILLAGAAVALSPSRSKAPPVNTNLIAVAPFRVSSPDSSLSYLREGIIDLLAATFNGEGGPRTVEPRSLIGVWNRAAARSGAADPDEETSLRLAEGIGAGRLVLGSAVVTGRQLSLRARLLDVPGGGSRGGQALAEGDVDSLQALVDQLASQLLGLQAGLERRRLSGLTSASLPAVQAYLRGQASFRRGLFSEAQADFREALEIDSTFALAALALSESVGTDGDARGLRLAFTYRAKLSPGDRALVEARAGPAYPARTTLDNGLAAWEQAADANPDRAEVWAGLGDFYYHNGAGVGVVDALPRADRAFRRAEALDSLADTRDSPGAPEALEHMMSLAVIGGDTARARHLVRVAFAADSSSVRPALAWLLAQATGDRASIDTLRTRPELFGDREWALVILFAQWTGIGVADGEPLFRHWMKAGALPDELASDLLLNAGRPNEALSFRSRSPMHSVPEARATIEHAMFLDGDTAAAIEAAAILARVAEAPRPTERANDEQVGALCTLEQWRLYRGQTGTAASAVEGLRRAEATLCADVIDAWLVTVTRRTDARRAVARLDSIARIGWPSNLNLIVARLLEAVGDTQGALRALRRRGSLYGLRPGSLATFLAEEGRLATTLGDTAGAISAWQHYLALRHDPEPALRPEVDRIRNRLAELNGSRLGR